MSEKKRGFALLSPERRKEIASLGGKACHAKGTAHEFTSEEAKVAGHKGGKRSHELGTGNRFTSETARAAALKRRRKQS